MNHLLFVSTLGWGWEDRECCRVGVVGFEGECWWLCNLSYAGTIVLSSVSINHLLFVSKDRWVCLNVGTLGRG